MVKLSINYIDDNGVRQIFSDIKSNLDSINNTATSAYTRANSAYTTANNANNLASLAYAGAITPGTQAFNIDGHKTFYINNGYFQIITNEKSRQSQSLFRAGRLYYSIVNTANTSQSATLELGYNYIKLSLLTGRTGAYIDISDKGLYMYDGKGHQGYINVANCI